jgi:hypothetical protein
MLTRTKALVAPMRRHLAVQCHTICRKDEEGHDEAFSSNPDHDAGGEARVEMVRGWQS